MKNWMGIIAGVVLALGLVSKSASAESFGGMMMPQPVQVGVATARISVGVSVPRVQSYYPAQPYSVCGINPCSAGYMNYPMPVAYGSHGMAGGGYGFGYGYGYGGGYGYGYGYGFGFRPMARCGHFRCARFKRCCYGGRRGFRSFSLGIRVGGFGMNLRTVSF